MTCRCVRHVMHESRRGISPSAVSAAVVPAAKSFGAVPAQAGVIVPRSAGAISELVVASTLRGSVSELVVTRSVIGPRVFAIRRHVGDLQGGASRFGSPRWRPAQVLLPSKCWSGCPSDRRCFVEKKRRSAGADRLMAMRMAKRIYRGCAMKRSATLRR